MSEKQSSRFPAPGPDVPHITATATDVPWALASADYCHNPRIVQCFGPAGQVTPAGVSD